MDEIQLPEYDEYFTVAALILANQPAPTLARIIRKFNIGYRRSQKILDQLDKEGFISLKDNKVLVTSGKEVQEKVDSMNLGVQTLYSQHWNQEY